MHKTPISVTILPPLQHGITNFKHGLLLHGHKTITFQTYDSYVWLLSSHPFLACLFSAQKPFTPLEFLCSGTVVS